MSKLFALAITFLPLAAAAQNFIAEPLRLNLVTPNAPLYRALRDSAGAPAVTASGPVKVTGQVNAHWAVVDFHGLPYYLPARYLAGVEGMTMLHLSQAYSTPLSPDPATGLFTVGEVLALPGVPQARLYGRTLEWVVKTYRSANASVQMQDKETGRIIAKGSTPVYTAAGRYLGLVQHTLTLYVKDDKLKYEWNDLHFREEGLGSLNGVPLETPKGYYSARLWQHIRQDAAGQLRVLAHSLARTLQAPDTAEF